MLNTMRFRPIETVLFHADRLKDIVFEYTINKTIYKVYTQLY